jgi:deoxyribonucleoside regulator
VGDLEHIRGLVRVAKLYHEEGLSEQEIARLVGTSRSTVSRMLTEAKRRGIVRISFAKENRTITENENELRERFRLKDVVTVPALGDGSEGRLKERLGAAAAAYVSEMLQPGQLLGISWGTTLFEVALKLRPHRVPGTRVVQLNGSVGQGRVSYLGARVLEIIAAKLGAQAFSFPAPAIVGDPAFCEALVREPSIAEALEAARKCDVAVFTVGIVDPSCVLVETGYLTADDIRGLRARGAVGDICSRFFDGCGQICDPDLDRRTLGLHLSDLASIPIKILVAGGQRKAAGILGALRAGYAEVLITDETTASEVAAMARGAASVRPNATDAADTVAVHARTTLGNRSRCGGGVAS